MDELKRYAEHYRTVKKCRTCGQPVAQIHADHGIRVSVGAIIDGLTELIQDGADNDTLCDFIDNQFLFGAWSEISNVAPPDFLRNVRGLLVGACRKRVAERTRTDACAPANTMTDG